ncbi:Memo-like protein [Enhygromyxa salina]|uniref:Memo-like protein n=1 Tax=Enhygromyxa salina TaxID=215803 RepID=A0A2S9XCH5_9BACT|nr:AmmeMemoRadiSam system protein B [Enhygromyxa salina]PRP90563.1 Memo-like protein [Enhygromyxa salina]
MAPGPKLRRLERLRMRRGDDELVVLRDPLELAEPIAIDASYDAVLDALDGQRTLAQIRQSLLMRGLVTVELADLVDFVEDLSEAGLLDDERFRELWTAAHEAFVEQDIRPPRRAGLLYPDQPEALRAWLAPALPRARADAAEPAGQHADDRELGGARGWARPPVAVVVPHQPPPSIAGPLRRLLAGLPAPEQYRRVVILATDHTPGLLPYASADKDWATPLGDVACDLELLAELDQRLPWLLREQTRLRVSDPIEWATLILRGLWGDRCPPVLPLACGQTRLTTTDGAQRARELVTQLDDLLGESTRAGQVLWWTAAELSHCGPAYGHAQLPEREQVELDDRELLRPLLQNQPQTLTRHLMDRDPAARPSGTAALVTLAELLPSDYDAALLDYQALPAPGDLPGWIGCPSIRFCRP